MEFQFGLRAFAGALPLQARPLQTRSLPVKQTAPDPALTASRAGQRLLVQREIAAAGRQQDIQHLMARLSRRDCKLIVLHGESGVGKSSLLSAGLIPTLENSFINAQEILPVKLRVYSHWRDALAAHLTDALTERGIQLDPPTPNIPQSESPPPSSVLRPPPSTPSSVLRPPPSTPSSVLRPPFSAPSSALSSEASLLEQLRQCERRHLRVVLIFDQFEEFFFVDDPDPERDQQFFDFLGRCLQVLSIKAILALRQDYLHYLLPCNKLESFAIAGNDILSRNVLYELGPFSRAEARTVIQQLTERSHFRLEPALIDALVEELADAAGQISPIELQVVGAQLQAENIATLDAYCQCGTKEALVNRYLAAVTADCGQEHQDLANLVLYLLTDDQGMRPLRTRAELEADLKALAPDLTPDASQLDLVLDIFVGSGLVFFIQEAPADRYQLVHDYLVPFIRRQQDSRIEELVAALAQERQQRRRSEEKVSQIEQANQILAEAKRQARREPLRQKSWLGWQMLVSALGTASLVMLLRMFGLFQQLEFAAFDRLFRLRPAEPVDERILIVAVEESDIAEAGQWPIPDAVFAETIAILRTHQPRAMGLGFFRDLPVEPGHQELVEVMKSTPNLIGITTVVGEKVAPPPILAERDRVALSDLVLDDDIRLRRHLLSAANDNNGDVILSLPMRLSLMYLEAEGIVLEQLDSDVHSFKLGRAVFKPLTGSHHFVYSDLDTGGYQILLNYRGTIENFDRVSLSEVLSNSVSPERIRDRAILIGSIARSIRDSDLTPYGKMASVTIHANKMSQILSAALDGRPLLKICSKQIEGAWILIWAVVGAILGWQWGSMRGLILGVLLSGTSIAALCYLAFLHGWWLSSVPPMIALATSATAAAIAANSQLEKLRLYRTLELTVIAYREDPAAGRSAMEFFLNSTDEKKATAQSLATIALESLKSCQTLEDIAAMPRQLAWMPSPPPDVLRSVLPDFLAISQRATTILDTQDAAQQHELANQSVAALNHLHRNLALNVEISKTVAIRRIAKQWLHILTQLQQAE